MVRLLINPCVTNQPTSPSNRQPTKMTTKDTQTINKLLRSLSACTEAYKWAYNKPWPIILKTCPRGDWLIWLFQKTNPNDLKLLTLTKAHCANTVRHLMKDKRSTSAIDVAIAFGLGKCSLEELNKARIAAAAAYAAAYADAYAAADAAYAAYTAYATHTAAYAAAYAAYAAAYAAYATNAGAYTAYAANAAAYAAAYAANAAAYARTKNKLKTADICRKYLTLNKWNITFD